jgi:ribosomal protein L16/L10AE
LDIKKEEYSKVRTLEKRKNKGNPGEGTFAASKSLVAAKTAYNKAKQALEAAKLAATMEIAKAFKLYRNLLSDEAGSLGIRSSRPK